MLKILMLISDDINAVNRYCALISSDAEIDNAVIVVNSDVMDNRDEIEVAVAVNHRDACRDVRFACRDVRKDSQNRGSK